MVLVSRFATIGLLALSLVGCSTGSSTSTATSTSTSTTSTGTSASMSVSMATTMSTAVGTSTTALETPANTVTDTVTGTVTDEDLTDFGVLVFHRTAGFVHESIPAGIASLTELGIAGGFTVTATDDAAVFADDSLAAFRVIVFLNTTGDILIPEQEQAMERFIRAGGGFIGVHAAADTEYDWAWYSGLVGAAFKSHPAPQPGLVEVLPIEHPITIGAPTEFVSHEEWYDFQSFPSPSVTILATVDEGSYTGGTMGDVHPIVWAHEYDGGRAAYLAFGHDAAAFDDPPVRLMLAQAIEWTSG
jgi:cytochrome c